MTHGTSARIASRPISPWDDITPEEVARAAGEQLGPFAAPFGGYGGMRLMRLPHETQPDSSVLMQILNRRDRPIGVLHCSQRPDPGAVARSVAGAQVAARLVGTPLSRHILLPDCTGTVEGRTYAVFPWRHTLAGSRLGWKLQRRIVGRYVLPWVRGVVAATRHPAATAAVEPRYVEPLRYLASHRRFSVRVRSRADEAARALSDRSWSPVCALDHNDMWKDNILLPRSVYPYPRFQVIDWGASNPHGYGVHDMLRLVDSLKMSRSRIRLELRRHARALGCDLHTLVRQHLAAMGYLGINRGYYPAEVYRDDVENLFSMLDGLAC